MEKLISLLHKARSTSCISNPFSLYLEIKIIPGITVKPFLRSKLSPIELLFFNWRPPLIPVFLHCPLTICLPTPSQIPFEFGSVEDSSEGLKVP